MRTRLRANPSYARALVAAVNRALDPGESSVRSHRRVDLCTTATHLWTRQTPPRTLDEMVRSPTRSTGAKTIRHPPPAGQPRHTLPVLRLPRPSPSTQPRISSKPSGTAFIICSSWNAITSTSRTRTAGIQTRYGSLSPLHQALPGRWSPVPGLRVPAAGVPPSACRLLMGPAL